MAVKAVSASTGYVVRSLHSTNPEYQKKEEKIATLNQMLAGLGTETQGKQKGDIAVGAKDYAEKHSGGVRSVDGL